MTIKMYKNMPINCKSEYVDIKYPGDRELLRLLFSYNINLSDLQKLEKSFGTFKELFFTDSECVKITYNINSETVKLLQCIREIIERSFREKLKSRPVLKSLCDVIEYCKTTMSALSIEQLRVMFLNNENMLLLDSVESHGTVNEVAIYSKNIIKKALNLEATGIILIHNHPSTSTKPSFQDVASTKKLVCVAEKVDIKVLDHIIIGGNNHFSMRKNKLI